MQDVTVDDAHIRAINKLAAKLEKRQSADELLTVRQRRQQLNDRWCSPSVSPLSAGSSLFHRKRLVSSRWNKFHGDLDDYKKKLEGALVVHALIRELEEVRDRANEKVSRLMVKLQVKPQRETDGVVFRPPSL